MERCELRDGDVVGAQIRPPRSQEQRFQGEFHGVGDENSWEPRWRVDLGRWWVVAGGGWTWEGGEVAGGGWSLGEDLGRLMGR